VTGPTTPRGAPAGRGVRVFHASRFREGRWSGVLAAGLLAAILAFVVTASFAVLGGALVLAAVIAAVVFLRDDYSWVAVTPGEVLIHRRHQTVVLPRETITHVQGSSWRAGIGRWNDIRDITIVLATGEEVDLPASIRNLDAFVVELRGAAAP